MGKDSVEVQEYEEETLGKYARLREKYLREYDYLLFEYMMFSGELDAHLDGIQEEADNRMDELVKAFLEKYPAPDRNEDFLAYVGHMNNLNAMAEEIVLDEIVYAGAEMDDGRD